MPKGEYTLAHDPRHISVFDVIKASGETRRSLHNERRQRMGTVPRYQPLRMVTQVVEDMLAMGVRIHTLQPFQHLVAFNPHATAGCMKI